MRTITDGLFSFFHFTNELIGPVLIFLDMEFKILLHIKMFHLLTNINKIIFDILKHTNLTNNQLPQAVSLKDYLLTNLVLDQVQVLGY